MSALRERRFGAAWLALSLVAGCKGCEKDKPYTPFGVASALPESAAPPDAGGAEEADAGAAAVLPKFAPRAALSAPGNATRWTLDGRELQAPAGRVFERGLAADFDADGSREAAVWTLPAAATPTASPGELWLFPAKGPAKKLLDLPGFVPTGPACKHTPSLAQTGPRSVTLDVAASCTTALLSRAPERSLSVLAPTSERPLLLTLRVAAPAPNEPFSLEVDSTDRDGDGRDDVRLVVSQKGATKDDKSVSAQVVWIDRAAGTSRDATEPAASLGLLAAAELGRSKRKQTAGQVPRAVAQVRRLMGTLCAEGATARLFEADGGMLSCAPLGVVVERLLTAEVQAALADGDPTRALGALERDGWYFGRAPDKRRAELEKSILAQATSVEPKETPVALQLAPRGAAPRLSPLAFEPSGALLALTNTGVSRVSPAGAVEALDPDAGVAAWPLALETQSGERLESVVFSCDRSEVHLSLRSSQGQKLGGLPSTLLSPRPGACAGGKPPPASVVVVGQKDDAPSLLVAGEPIGPRVSRAEAVLRPRLLGSPRSPDGRWSVLPTSLGLWLEGGDKPELWRVKDARSLSECTVADGGKAVACVSGTTARLFSR